MIGDNVTDDNSDSSDISDSLTDIDGTYELYCSPDTGDEEKKSQSHLVTARIENNKYLKIQTHYSSKDCFGEVTGEFIVEWDIFVSKSDMKIPDVEEDEAWNIDLKAIKKTHTPLSEKYVAWLIDRGHADAETGKSVTVKDYPTPSDAETVYSRIVRFNGDLCLGVRSGEYDGKTPDARYNSFNFGSKYDCMF